MEKQQTMRRYLKNKGSILFYVPSSVGDRRSISTYIGLEHIVRIAQKEGFLTDRCRMLGRSKFETCLGREISEYDIIAVSMYYGLQSINLIPFLSQTTDKQLKIVGGSACYNPMPFHELFDYVFIGDSEESFREFLHLYASGSLPSAKFITQSSNSRKEKTLSKLPNENYIRLGSSSSDSDLHSPLLIRNVNGPTGYIEINRGCKHGCKFCYIRWNRGDYLEKNLDMIKEQILEAKRRGIRKIHFNTASFFCHKYARDILEFSIDKEIKVMNSNYRIRSIVDNFDLLHKVVPHSMNTGIESYTKESLIACKKGITIADINEGIELMNRNFSRIHYYLIYGLPKSEDQDILEFIKLSEQIRKNSPKRNIINYSINPFEPSYGTPYALEDKVDYTRKSEFDKEVGKLGVVVWGSKGTERYNSSLYFMNSNMSEVELLKELHKKGYYLSQRFNKKIWEFISLYVC